MNDKLYSKRSFTGSILNQERYTAAEEEFKAAYPATHENKPAGKKEIKIFEAGCSFSKANILSRNKSKDSVEKQLMILMKDMPNSKKNSEKKVEKKQEEIDTYLPELGKIESQLKELAVRK